MLALLLAPSTVLAQGEWINFMGELDPGMRAGADAFTAPNLELPYYRIFGGQLLAQAIAIGAVVGGDSGGGDGSEKSVKSLHVSFPRQGDLRKPVGYRLERLQEGRTFSSLALTGRQEGKAIFAALLSLHVAEAGLDHQASPPEVAGPDEATATDLSMIPWETRIVGGVDLGDEEVGSPSLEIWMRAPALPDEQHVHQALLAHATDLTLIGTTLRPHEGVSEAHSPDRIQTAVTTHTVWFHRPFRLDEWLLLVQESPSAAGARGFASGHAFSHAGDLVASYAQESMIRPVDATPGSPEEP